MSRHAKFVRSFAPVAVLLAAAFTQACTAETTDVVTPEAMEGEAAQNEAPPTEASAIAERLSGNFTAPAKIGEGLDQTNKGLPVPAAAEMEVSGLG